MMIVFWRGLCLKIVGFMGKKIENLIIRGVVNVKKKLDDDTVNSLYSGILSENFHLNK